MLELHALPGLPEIRPGDDLAALLAAAAGEFAPGDVLAVAHKVVSKAEGRIVHLADVTRGRVRSRSPPSTARTRATSRSCCPRPRSSCAPTPGA